MKDSVFIHGILRRSGTNFLNQLLLLHPDFEQSALKVRENWFLHHSGALFDYYDGLNSLWSNVKWGGKPYKEHLFFQKLGEAQLAFLYEDVSSQKRLLTKTPSFKNVQFFDQFFPESKQILIVRNPFDVAASTYKTWGIPVERTLAEWQDGCIEAFKLESKQKVLVIRYEDLLSDTENVLKSCFTYLDLDASPYKWEAVKSLPVFGSSDQGENWKVVEKSDDFKAISKWKNLPDEILQQLAMFNKEAFNAYFGYDTYFATGVLKALPALEHRIQSGKELSLLTKPNLNKKNTIQRKAQFKKGVKLIFNAIKP